MSTETETAADMDTTTDAVSWKGSALAGVVAGFVMGR